MMETVYDQIRRIYSNHTEDDALVDRVYDTLFSRNADRGVDLALTHCGDVGLNLRIVFHMPIGVIMQRLQRCFTPISTPNMVTLIQGPPIFRTSMAITIVSVTDDYSMSKFIASNCVFMVFTKGEYRYMYDNIKHVKHDVNSELLNSELLARIRYHPKNVKTWLDASGLDIADLSFDEMY